MSSTAGYHVWAAFDGHTDFANMDGQGGQPISARVTSHRYDAGLPQNIKDADWLEVYINKGKGVFSITVSGDLGSLATISLEATSDSVKYNSGAKYNDGSKYATTGATTRAVGLAPNTEGRALDVTFFGELTDELEIGGWAVDAVILPKREYSHA